MESWYGAILHPGATTRFVNLLIVRSNEMERKQVKAFHIMETCIAIVWAHFDVGGHETVRKGYMWHFLFPVLLHVHKDKYA